MKQELVELISQNEESGDFARVEVSDEQIKAFEKKLKVTLPSEYVEFLKTYGRGGIGGVEIMGIGFENIADFLDETVRMRKHGLPKNLIIFENCDEWYNCVDCNTGEVCSWEEDGEPDVISDSFDEYLLEAFTEALEY